VLFRDRSVGTISALPLDDQEIEFTANDTSTSSRNLYAVRPDGTDMRFVLREPWAIFQPAWQP
jgi:hypothetical protein